MDPCVVILPKVKGKGSIQVLPLLTVSIGQPGKPSHLHSDGKVLPFNMRSRNLVDLGIATNYSLGHTYYVPRRVASGGFLLGC